MAYIYPEVKRLNQILWCVQNIKFLVDIETQTFELSNLSQDPLNIDMISFETKEFGDNYTYKGN